jgi:hypothetical protein
MIPTLPAFLVVGALVALGVLVGVAAGRRQARRSFAAHRDYCAALEADLHRVERDLDHLAAEAATFPHRLQAAYDAGQAAARQTGAVYEWPLPASVLLPPEKWRTLREAQENGEAN